MRFRLEIRPDVIKNASMQPLCRYSRVSILRSVHSRKGYIIDLFMWGFQQYVGYYSENQIEHLWQHTLWQHTHKSGAFKHMGGIFWENKC